MQYEQDNQQESTACIVLDFTLSMDLFPYIAIYKVTKDDISERCTHLHLESTHYDIVALWSYRNQWVTLKDLTLEFRSCLPLLKLPTCYCLVSGYRFAIINHYLSVIKVG